MDCRVESSVLSSQIPPSLSRGCVVKSVKRDYGGPVWVPPVRGEAVDDTWFEGDNRFPGWRP